MVVTRIEGMEHSIVGADIGHLPPVPVLVKKRMYLGSPSMKSYRSSGAATIVGGASIGSPSFQSCRSGCQAALPAFSSGVRLFITADRSR